MNWQIFISISNIEQECQTWMQMPYPDIHYRYRATCDEHTELVSSETVAVVWHWSKDVRDNDAPWVAVLQLSSPCNEMNVPIQNVDISSSTFLYLLTTSHALSRHTQQ